MIEDKVKDSPKGYAECSATLCTQIFIRSLKT
jgi:hypothetical protein